MWQSGTFLPRLWLAGGLGAAVCLTALFLQASRSGDGQGAVAHTSSSAEQQVELGRQVYQQTCFVCHQLQGQGLPRIFPPLARSDYLLADKARPIRGLLQGQSGEMIVNGRKYNSVMPPMPLSDAQIAAVLTYVLNSWGNNGGVVSIDEVSRVRAELARPATGDSITGTR
jgi:nitrite reductase (NO-forming)